MRRLLFASFSILFLAGIATPQAADEARLLRFPAIHGDSVVFTYAGNLYTVPAAGGIARRLTNHEGFEMFARFSPDGKQLAFTGQYDGNTEVYLMPAEGGTPKRLTYTATLGRDDVSDRMGPNNIVMGWTPDGTSVLFRSRMNSFNPFIGQLFTVNVNGSLPEQLPLPRGGFASYSPDGSKLVYNRIFREFRTWKRYRGGLADEIWTYDFKTKKTEQLTDNPASDIIPMWAGDKIYFLSDRDGDERFNIWRLDPKSKETKQITKFTEFDCKFPSLGDKAIVFENGGYIYKLDLASEQVAKVPVRILEDAADARGGLTDVSKNIASFGLSPAGKRAVFTARGDVFTVPASHGITRNLTNTPGVHDRDADWSPDGKTIAYISDASGEDEIYTIAQDGSAKPVQLTSGGDTYKYGFKWSPDAKKIAWTDRKQRLQFIDLATKKVTLVNHATAFEIRDFAWSPDFEVAGVWTSRGRHPQQNLALFARKRQDNRSHRRLVRRQRAAFLERRQVSVLRLRSGLPPHIWKHGIQPRLHRHATHVPDYARQGHTQSIQAEGRRSRRQPAGAKVAGQAQEGGGEICRRRQDRSRRPEGTRAGHPWSGRELL